MQKILIAAMLLATLAAGADRTIYRHLESGAEMNKLTLSASNEQLIYARVCDVCDLQALSIDGSTRVYDGRQRIDLATAAGFTDRGATVFFDPETRRVTRIVFWKQ